MSLCIPYNVIEPIMGAAERQQNWFSYQRKGGQDDHIRKLTRNVSNAPVEMRAFLAQTTMTLNDLLALQVGDVITTEKADRRGRADARSKGRTSSSGRSGSSAGAGRSGSPGCARTRRR